MDNTALNYGVINSLVYNLRTGNVLLDTILTLLLTTVITKLFSSFKLTKICKWRHCCRKPEYIRRIKAKWNMGKSSQWEEDDTINECENSELIRSVFYYLHKSDLRL